jgi:hypothetical protein
MIVQNVTTVENYLSLDLPHDVIADKVNDSAYKLTSEHTINLISSQKTSSGSSQGNAVRSLQE